MPENGRDQRELGSGPPRLQLANDTIMLINGKHRMNRWKFDQHGRVRSQIAAAGRSVRLYGNMTSDGQLGYDYADKPQLLRVTSTSCPPMFPVLEE